MQSGAQGGGSPNGPNTPEPNTPVVSSGASGGSGGIGGGGSGGGGSGDSDPMAGKGVPTPMLAPPQQPIVRGPVRANRPVRLSSNRDWIIPVECDAKGARVLTAGSSFSLAELQQMPADRNPLYLALKSMIDRRQATVRTGEMEYHPQLRFRVYPDGLRAYYLAYPVLELLKVPMTRELVEPEKENGGVQR